MLKCFCLQLVCRKTLLCLDYYTFPRKRNTHTYTNTHTCAHKHTHTHTHTQSLNHTDPRTHTHMHMYMHTHTCAHTQSHTHTHTLKRESQRIEMEGFPILRKVHRLEMGKAEDWTLS